MFARLLVVLAILAVAAAFGPARMAVRSSRMQMSAERPNMAKVIAAGIMSASLFGSAAFAVEGASPKQSFFGDSQFSSPFTINENREDPIYSPYSPYGNGKAAVYNGRAGGSEEIAFWKNQLATCVKRVDNIPALNTKSLWQDIRTELTSYSYNMREAMLRLAAASPNAKAAEKAARLYFEDIGDIFVASEQKNNAAVTKYYEKSVADLSAFSKLL